MCYEYADLKNRLDRKIKYLESMIKKYSELNKMTKGAYNWRQQAIEGQLETLEELRDDTEDCWDLCYEEDFKESR